MTHRPSSWLRNVIIVYLLNILWAVLATLFIAPYVDIDNDVSEIPHLWFWAVAFAPVVEELIFRLIGVGLALAAFGRSNWLVWLAAVLVGGILFGRVHGKPGNILLQGVGGFNLAWLYVRNTEAIGVQRFRGHLVGWLGCVLAHAAHNATALAVVELLKRYG